MSSLVHKSWAVELMTAAPQPGHALGPVTDDWEAAEVWLRAVARKSRNGSVETVTTYRFHLNKLRWYCEYVARMTPSRWSIQDVDRFKQFLANVPADALCARMNKGFVWVGDAGYIPFRTQPSASSRSDIARFVHAMFKTWHAMGYLRINPMVLDGAGARRKINAQRSIDLDVLQVVLATLERDLGATAVARMTTVRDRFILIALQELGLRAIELVGSAMGAFYRLVDPKSKQRYWIFKVDAARAKGGRERQVPVTRTLLRALQDYRMGFGLPPNPVDSEWVGLLLSPYTRKLIVAGSIVCGAHSKRYFGEFKQLTTRHHLYAIVKNRLQAASDVLVAGGEEELASALAAASPHWLRHTFAKDALNKGQSMREVASLLGHAGVDTTMVYTDQEALDLVRSFKREKMDLAKAD